MRPTSSFRLAKSTKRILATILDPVKKNKFKKDMIESQLHSASAQLKALKTKEKE